jgi:hypothetical protein
MIDSGPAGLSDGRLLDAWEAGHPATPIDRAGLLFEAGRSIAGPRDDASVDIDDLTLGMLDAGLLSCHEATFGSRIEALAQCPACDEQLGFGFELDDVRSEVGRPDERFEVVSSDGRYRADVRLPTLADLRAAAGGGVLDDARRILDRRCISGATRDGQAVDVDDLPDEVVEEAGRVMAARDRQADVRLALDCPVCGHRWEARFDIAAFLWQEIDARARRLLVDVHTLATAYGWSEAEILALPAERRRAYLELVLG